jgi:sortase A
MNFIKKIPKRITLSVVFVGIFFILIVTVYFYAFLKKNIHTSLYTKEAVNYPVNLEISKIKVSAIFEPLGINSSGEMDAPKSPSSVGWYNLGPLPGDVGSSVVAGHSGWKGGAPAVFDDLYKLKKGDKLYVKNAKGDGLTFIVKNIKTYNPNDDAFDVFNSSDNIAHLNLVTCSGVWDTITKSHTKRLVVFTDRE